MGTFARPRRLSPDDNVEHFSCGQPELDNWLRKFALVSQKSGSASVFVSISDEQVAGYYALATGGVDRTRAPDRVKQGQPAHPIPVILLARLAVDSSCQNMGLGRGLLRDALIRVHAISEEVGVRALLVHAKDEAARDFYLRNAQFEPSPTDDLHLFLLMKDLRKALPASSADQS